MTECANCGEDYAYRHEFNGHRVCLDCSNALGGELVQTLESKLTEARYERDEAYEDKALLGQARDNLLAELRQANERAEKAEAERDEARAQAVWAIQVNAPIGWVACAPGGGAEGLRLVDGAWVEQTMCVAEGSRFPTEEEALDAGRALPWWEVQA